jgi:hypothetical protein
MTKSVQNIITILALIVFFPLGIVLMFVWKLYNPWARIFISGCLILFFGTFGYALWRLNRIISKVDSLASQELVLIDQKNVQKSNYNIPTKDTFDQSETIIANGIQLTIKGFSQEKYTNKIFKQTANYCAVSLNIKNILAEDVAIAPVDMFMLSPEGVEMEFPLTNITGLAQFESKPAINYLGETKFILKNNESREGFIPFECTDFKSSYIFQSDINQYAPEVISDELDWKPVRIKLSFQGPPQQVAVNSTTASVSSSPAK